jgi:hypothetical protein
MRTLVTLGLLCSCMRAGFQAPLEDVACAEEDCGSRQACAGGCTSGLVGFGSATPAGRGGQIIKVTTLADSGPGSLREAVAAPGPRVIVFEVSGHIDLTAFLRITQPYVTIAGQTAPSPGVTLRNAGISVETNDVLIQHLRIRVGDSTTGATPNVRDGFQLLGPNGHNIVLDHLSISWAIDENTSTWYADGGDLTISNSIIAEGLYDSLHSDGPHSFGMFLGFAKNVSVLGNLLAHNFEHNPGIQGGASVVFANNVVYDWGTPQAGFVMEYQDMGPLALAAVGNVYLPGPNTPPAAKAWLVDATVPDGTRLFISDNRLGDAVPLDPWTLVQNDATPNVAALSAPLWPNGFTALASSATRTNVLANAGARPADRDAVDERIVQQVASGTGGYVNAPADVGGWPTLAENVRVLELPADPSGDEDEDGYTNAEEWLQQFTDEVE